MTIADETRFRHLAACIEVNARHLSTDWKPNQQALLNIQAWTAEMLSLLPERTQKGASRNPAKKSGIRATPDKLSRVANH